jgi:hypothetical protein
MRSRPAGAVGYCFPAVVVADTDELVALYQPSGTVCKRRSGSRGGPRGRSLIAWDGTYVDAVFRDMAMHVWVPGDAFWVIRRWAGTSFEGWYINLADPWTRTAIGFDYVDHILDIVATPDRSSWQWKDEDELDWAVESSQYSRRAADEIRARGLEAVARMEEGLPPFHDWSELKPEARWPVPSLPEDWAEHASDCDP